MSLTAAMQTGFTGINSNSVVVDTVGNNLANLNTTAFKFERALLETLNYRTISEGEAPDDDSGGTLPRQIGTGSTVGAIDRNFTQGGLDQTGFPADLALQGDGFFVLSGPTGDQLYTRDGAFRLDQSQTLVSADGFPVQVFPADANGNIQVGTLSDLSIPLGSATPAVATTEAIMDGRLASATDVAAAGAIVTSQAFVTAGGGPATATTPLTALVTSGGLPLFADGDVLSVQGAKGGISTPREDFIVGTTGSTLGDFAQFLEDLLGINTDPVTGGSPGVTISDGTQAPAGAILIQSNFGEINAVAMDDGSVTNTTGAITSPMMFDTQQQAVGQGVTTSFAVFDSLGNSVDVRLRLALESKSQTGTTWRFYAESVDDTDLSPVLGTGTITFDTSGRFVSATNTGLSIDRAGVGSTTPLTLTTDFSQLAGVPGPDGTSDLILDSQDGAPPGTLSGFSIDADGIVTAAFTNQQTQVLGQIALARFPNNQGLVAQSSNIFLPGPDSGAASIVAPRTEGTGFIESGALEQSNVEIAREFISLIQASTGISSASRVVRVADELLQELLLLAR